MEDGIINRDWLVGAIDAGTTSARMLIFNRRGEVVCSSQRRIKLLSPFEGWAEHDPKEMIFSVNECLNECGDILKGKGLLNLVKGIGLAVHRESVLAFNRNTGEPFSNIILWLDTRTRDIIKEYNQYEELLISKTGLKLSTYFSAFKMRWLMRHMNSTAGTMQFGTMDTWLLYNLTGEYKTDFTNASRTMLLNIVTKQYDSDLLDLFGINSSQLPKICPSIHKYGVIRAGHFKGIPITSVFGDQQASLLGQDCVKKGDIKCTLGTGAFILMNSGEDLLITEEFITTIISDGWFGLEAPIAMASSGVNWIRENVRNESKPNSSNGVIFVPALTGLLSPFWRPDISSSFHYLTLNSTPENMVAAVLESIAFSVALCIEILTEKYKFSIATLNVDGGLSNDEHLLQMIADITALKVQTPELKECSARGAAIGAAKGADLEWERVAYGSKVIEPRKGSISELYAKWKKVMDREINKQ